MSPSRLLRSCCTAFTLSLLVLGLNAAIAAADEAVQRGSIPHLTDPEKAMVETHQLSDGARAPAGPFYYVAPNIRVIERQLPPTEPLTDMKRMKTYMSKSGTANLSSILTNGGFEDGNFNGWTTSGNLGSTAASVCAAAWPADAFITNPGTLGSANNAACINAVYRDTHSARLGDENPWGNDPSHEPKCSSIYQDAVIPAGTVNFKFAYAVMAQNPGHGFGQDPYFNVKVEDLTAATTLYDVTDYTTSFNPANPCTPWCAGAPGVVYRCWTEVGLDLSALTGHTVRVSLKGSDCSPSGHWCSVFLDGAGIFCNDTDVPDAAPISATCAPIDPQTLCATVSWLAPSDPTSVPNEQTGNCDPTTGPVAAYDLRWSTSPILTAADFALANQVTGEPTPSAPGSAESMQVCGLPDATVYFALQSSDASFNVSALSTTQTECHFNQPPECSNATASEAVLWPPNHSYHGISILGVTDPDEGDVVTITVDNITQDEPLNTRGDGNTCPDGIIEDGAASVRAERTGTPGIPGNGRVYAINFTATDSHGATCTGTVNVCVPHDMSDPTCIDDGQRYSSTGDCHGGNSVQTEVAAYGLSVMSVSSNEATIEFAVPKESNVQVGVFDVAGRRLAMLENSTLAMGRYTRTWNMSGVSNGLYYVRMNAGSTTVSKTVLKLQ